MSDLFDFGFGSEFDDFFSMGEKKSKEKKAEPKKAEPKKKDEKKTTKAAGKSEDIAVTCPLTVKAKGFQTTIEEGVKSLSEVVEKLVEQGFAEMKIKDMKLFYIEAVKTVYVDDTALISTSGDAQVLFGEDEKVTVACGGYNSEYTVEHFDGKDVDEVSLSDVTALYVQQNPTYGGCSFYFDRAESIAYPVAGFIGVLKEDTIEVIVNGGSTEVAVEGRTYDAIAKSLAGELGGGKAELKIGGGKYFLTYSCGKNKFYCAGGGAGASSSKGVKTAKEKYVLPFNLFIPQLYITIPCTADMFDGKEKVVQADVEAFLKKHPGTKKFASDTERKMSFLYSDADGSSRMVSVGFNSAKKGAGSEAAAMLAAEERYESPWHIGECKMIRDRAELEEVRKMDSFYGHYTGEGQSFVFRALPYGNFYLHGFYDEPKRVEYEHKLVKLPRAVLDAVISIFRQDLSKEALVRVIFNRRTGEANIVVGNTHVVSKTGIVADFKEIMHHYLDKDTVCVAEIHSHNTMPAFWSGIDNADEKDYPGIFGVIGNLDNEEPSMLFRASFEGMFGEVAVSDLFEM